MFIERSGITDLVLNSALGWEGKDISFLAELPFLRGIEVIGVIDAGDWALRKLEKLERLVLNYCLRFRVRLENLQELKYVSTPSWKGAESLFEIPHLETLQLFDFSLGNGSSLSKLASAVDVQVSGGNLCSLNWTGGMNNLRMLSLSHLRSLRSFDTLGACGALERLQINSLRNVESFHALTRLPNIRFLYLCDIGPIKNIHFVAELKTLEELYIFGKSSIEDGDLSHLGQLPRLKKWIIEPRRNYSGFPTRGGS